MLEPSGDAKRSAYSREDDSARRLWLTQRTKANPWEHRSKDPEDEEAQAPLVREIAARAPEKPARTTIGQTDRLKLDAPVGTQVVENPFAKLVLNRLQLGERDA